MSMSEISRLVKCCLYLSKEFPNITPNENINYIKTLLGNFDDINIPLEIINNLEPKLKAYKQKKNWRRNFSYGISKY